MRFVRQEKPSGPHQSGSVSALTQAFQTRLRGAAMVRWRSMVRARSTEIVEPRVEACAIPRLHVAGQRRQLHRDAEMASIRVAGDFAVTSAAERFVPSDETSS